MLMQNVHGKKESIMVNWKWPIYTLIIKKEKKYREFSIKF